MVFTNFFKERKRERERERERERDLEDYETWRSGGEIFGGDLDVPGTLWRFSVIVTFVSTAFVQIDACVVVKIDARGLIIIQVKI